MFTLDTELSIHQENVFIVLHQCDTPTRRWAQRLASARLEVSNV